MSEDARNESSATIGGHSVQAGQIHGGVHFHHDGGSERTPVIPRQLPTASRHFTNRAVEQDALTTLLNGPATEDRVLVSTMDGTAGVGKSTLAVHWAHRMRDRFPDGELYANLRGFDPAAEPMPASEALGAFLTGLGVTAERVPVEAEARAALFRSLLHGKRMLVLLDNARSAEQVRSLLPASPTCLVLVTSRNRLQDLVIREGALRMTLDVLTDDEARDLLRNHLGQQRLEDEPRAVDQLIEHCAGLPLALGIVAFRAAEEPEFPLHVLVDELRDERERLDALDAGGETGVRAVFSWSYRSYETTEQRDTAVRRLLDHYLRTSHRIEQQVVPHVSLPVENPPESEIRGLQFEDNDSAHRWWDDEHANLMAAVQQANQLLLHDHAWKLTLTLRYFLKVRSHTEDWLHCNELALRSARASGARAVEAHLLMNSGVAHYRRGEFTDTAHYQQKAKDLFNEVGDHHWEGVASFGLGDAHLQSGEHQAAKTALHHALDLHQHVDDGDHVMLADIRTQIGELCTTTGNAEEALRHLREAQHLYEGSSERIGVGTLLNAFGRAHHLANSLREAQQAYEQAVDHRKLIGDRRGEVTSLRELGVVLRDNGNDRGARTHWQAALDRLEAVEDPYRAEARAQLNQLIEQHT